MLWFCPRAEVPKQALALGPQLSWLGEVPRGTLEAGQEADHSMSFLEWVSLRAELKAHWRAGSRGCTCPVAHPRSPYIHFTFGFPGQLGYHALMGQLHTLCHAGGQQMINRHVFISLQHQTCACPLGGRQDSFPSHLCWPSPRECRSGRRALHYCQPPLTGTTPLSCF